VARIKPREAPRPPTGQPSELSSRVHPIWKDHAAVVERFGQYLSPTEVTSSAGRNLHQTVINAWAVAHGFTDHNGAADWQALRAAGVLQRP